MPENSLFKLPKSKEEAAAVSSIAAKKPFRKKTHFHQDLNKYQDPDGITIARLDAGYWLIRNRPLFYRILLLTLLVISTATWGRFLYVYGSYFLFGWRYDNAMLADLARDTVNPAVLLAQSPRHLQLGGLQAVKSHSGNYDFTAEVFNPNTYHISQFSYHLSANGQEFGHGKVFLFPEDRRHLAILNQDLEGINPAAVKLVVDGEAFNRLSKHTYPDWQKFYKEHMNFEVSNKLFDSGQRSPLSEKMILNDLRFDIANRSAYNYWRVDFNIILKNQVKVIGVDTYSLDEFRSGQNRNIQIAWPGDLPAVQDIVIEPLVNILDEKIYMDFQGDPKDIF